MIIKVHKTIHSFDLNPVYEITNEEGTLKLKVFIGENEDLDKLMYEYTKRYFHAKHKGTCIDIDFGKPCKNEPWW